MNFGNKLKECSDFKGIFDLVKSAVETTIDKRRIGLILGLTNLPLNIGAFHQVGSNFIIMNKALLKKIAGSNDKKLTNSYLFHVLLHEYLHSLGYLNEQETQILAYEISKSVLGAEHAATLIARYGIGYLLSGIGNLEQYQNEEIDGIETEDIETDNLNYFG